MDPRQIRMRYLKSDFIIDLTAALPLPQILGASWYLASIGRQHSGLERCTEEFERIPPCNLKFLDCSSIETGNLERQYWLNMTKVLTSCAKNDDSDFKFGIFAEAFTSEVASSRFFEKYLYCLWWGLRNLSSYGQNLGTSTYLGETTFCIVLCISGLILFAQIIGNMQTYLSSMTVKLEEWRIKKRDTEEWMRHRQLPEDLQERVRRFEQYKWLTTRGVNEEEILKSLPHDLRREIQRHLCLNLVRRVPFFAQMDDQLLDAICERLVSSLSTKGSYIVREGDPVNEMLFIIRGQMESSTTNGGRSGFYNSITLRPGDFCGEELLTWALVPNSSLNLPCSTRTVKTLTEVEAFALQAEDLKFVANQFKRLHSMKLQHAFSDEQDGAHSDEETGEGTSVDSPAQNLSTTILASRFAANTRRVALQRIAGAQPSSLKMPKLLKPDEPDFSGEV
ncbi:UNVERIFIED_CONTAM: Cyclic nucleotide-gated ion channel 18 [Sesamum radiatum]|uniref:Cyclic nucleotide-gated ion channel 18 n=1 Tax=Sesamum radiatum TaxID=300843 RepID=A0AAW2RCW4_SESRA